MKLELKHLVGYLPYGLEVMIDLGCSSTIANISKNGFDSDFLYALSENKVKIIGLRPLSDLTKEIEVNGEKFVPQNKLSHLDLKWLITSDNLIMKTNYEDVLKLLEWHFDIYGLIENNLAIDINTLNNDN